MTSIRNTSSAAPSSSLDPATLSQAGASDDSAPTDVIADSDTDGSTRRATPLQTGEWTPTDPLMPCPPPVTQILPKPAGPPGYELLGVLGRGGMGIVYQARQVQLNRHVALKMLLAGGHASEMDLVRFTTEAEAIARLKHPNIVQIHEIGRHDSLPFFSLEFCGGGNLAGLLRGNPLPATAAAALVETLARAIHAAHEAGIIHRDLKPANILFSLPQDPSRPSVVLAASELERTHSSKPRAGLQVIDTLPAQEIAADQVLRSAIPKITDFGLAKKLDDMDGPTLPGAIMGTPSYMAPEQAAGLMRDIGPATDVYALGVILYETLAGRPPFKGSSIMATLEQVRTVEPIPPGQLQPKLPRDLDTICLKCLEKDPSRRYPSAAALADDLKRFLANEPILARATPGWERVWKWAKRRPGLAAMTAAMIAGVVLSFMLILSQWLRAEAAGEDARRLAEKERKDKELIQEQNLKLELAEQNANRQRLEAQRLSVNLLIEKGVSLCDQGQCGAGLLWLAKALERTPAEAPDQSETIRALLGGWSTHLGTPSALYPVPGDPPVSVLAVSHDGKQLLLGDRGGKARLWDTATRRPVGEPLLHKRTVSAVAFSADDKLLATGCFDGKARLWERISGKLLLELEAHQQAVNVVVFSPDSSLLVSAGKDQEVYLWDTQTGKLVAGPLAHQGVVSDAAFTPDGKHLLTCSFDRTARLWSVPEGKPAGQPLAHNDEPVHSVAVSPDGKQALTGTKSGRVRFWNLESGQPLGELPPQGGPIVNVAFSRDGASILTALQTGVVVVWDAASRQPRGEPWRHQSGLQGAFFDPSGEKVFACGIDGAVREWQLPARSPVGQTMRHEGLVLSAAFSPDGSTLLTSNGRNAAQLWEVPSGRPRGGVLLHDRPVVAVGFSPDGSIALTRCADFTVRLWRPDTAKPLGKPMRHAAGVTSISFSPDGHTLLTSSADGTVRRWSVPSGEPLGEPLRHKGAATWACFNPDGKTFLTGSFDQTIRLWDALTGEALSEPLPVEGMVETGFFSADGRHALIRTGKGLRCWAIVDKQMAEKPLWRDDLARRGVFSPNGELVLTACTDQTARLRKTATGELVGAPLRHQAAIDDVAFSLDGRLALTRGGTIARLWDTTTTQPIGEALAHTGTINQASFSPDSRRVLTASVDGAARLWDAASGKALCGPYLHGAALTVAQFDPNGDYFFLGGRDSQAHLWRVPAPLSGDSQFLKLRLQVSSGQELDSGGALHALDSTMWQRRYLELHPDELAGNEK